jgi:hypothetical protein
MPRGKYRGLGLRSPQTIELALKYHVTAVRLNKQGAITSVNHSQLGWITIERYYMLQQLKEVGLPIFIEVVKAGYILKAAVWTITIDARVLDTGVNVPIGVFLVIIALSFYAVDSAAGHPVDAFLDLFSLVLPFGEIWLLYKGGAFFKGIVDKVQSWLSDPANLLLIVSPTAGEFYRQLLAAGTALNDALKQLQQGLGGAGAGPTV